MPITRRQLPFISGVASLIGIGIEIATASVAAAPGSPQAVRGVALYGAKCASCHGAQLRGGIAPALQPLKLASVNAPNKPITAAELANWIRLNMPVSDPGSLTKAHSLDLVAYLLVANAQLPAGGTLAPANAATIVVKRGGR